MLEPELRSNNTDLSAAAQNASMAAWTGPKKSTIEHRTAYMDESETLDMLKVKTLAPLFDKNAHLKEIRGNLDKRQQYAE